MDSPSESRKRARPSPPHLGQRLGMILIAALAIALPSCASQEPWTFGTTRAAYGDYDWNQPLVVPPASRNDWGMLAILLLPVAIDVVLLPVTLPHDLLFD